MTNTLAVILGVLLISVFAVDQIYYDGTLLVIIMEQLVRLSQYLAFLALEFSAIPQSGDFSL